MKAERIFPKCIITKKGTAWTDSGHPWIYEGEVIHSDECENGALIDAVSENGKYIGTGFFSTRSKIRVRLVSRNANDRFDEAFWERRVRYALEYRKTVMGSDISCCRIIFGEADGFPGLTVDRFSDVLVAQALSAGIERIKSFLYPAILRILREDFPEIRGIYERNDVKIRDLEGLPQYKGWFGSIPENSSTDTIICENGIRYKVDFENGQKTGFFLDQKYNRLAASKIARGKTVLDCFTHTGSFALNAAFAGAKHVTAVDISESAVSCAKENAELNGLSEKIDFQVADVFDLLSNLEAKHSHEYDFIILDPPAFTKSRKTVSSAEKGYKEINYRAMKLLPRGGYLATCSCSHFMPQDLFIKMLKSAARDAGVELKQIEVLQQGPDHPILWNVPETDYLKFFIFQIV